MDVTPLLLLALVGGYIFSNTCNAIRYRAVREEGHRLYFRAAFYGVFLFFAALLLRLWLIAEITSYREWEQSVRVVVQPVLKDNSGDSWIIVVVSVLALILGSTLAVPLNRIFFWKSKWLLDVVKEDEFESLLHRALARAKPVALTMENAKVYVGFVFEVFFDPQITRKNLSILPIMSGYRAENGKVSFTTFYEETMKSVGVGSGGRTDLSLDDFKIVLPVNKVQSANLFDIETYNHFQKLQPSASAEDRVLDDRTSWRSAPAARKIKTSLWTR